MSRRIRAVALCCLVLLGLAGSVRAQQPQANRNQQALELAKRLGRERSAEGLETIIAARNVDLLRTYVSGFQETSARLLAENDQTATPLPADIETLIVTHYSDAQIGTALRGLVGHGTKYQTRRLFDLMYAEWRSGKQRASTYSLRDSIFRTDLAIEAPLLEWLQAQQPPESSDGQRIILLLGERKYRSAMPVLAAMIRDARPGAPLVSPAYYALLKIAPADAAGAALRRFAWLRGQSAGPEVARETDSLITWIAQLPADTPLDYAAFRRALPATPSDAAKNGLLKVIAVRKEQKGVADVLHLLGETKFYPRTLEILIAFDSPEVWKQARAEVERLKGQGVLDDSQYRYASAQLDTMIANPEKHFAEKRQRERQQAFETKKAALYASRNDTQKLKDRSPEPYVVATLDFLQNQDRLAREYSDLGHAVGLRGEVGQGYLDLAGLVRFRLKQPDRAIELYARAEQLGTGMASFSIADTYQFDLRDTVKALEGYQRLLQELQHTSTSDNDIGAGFAAWAKAWLTHQIDYVKTGRRFGGTIGQSDVGGAAMLLYARPVRDDYFGLAPLHRLIAEAQPVDRSAVAQKLDALPSSGLTLLSTTALVTLLPDAESILRYLGKHDPAGYASASLFALVDVLDRQAGGDRNAAQLLPGLVLPPSGAANPLRVAAARFVKERNIDLNTRSDPRMASPEMTWNLLIVSLKSGDVDTAMACLTPNMQSKFRSLFTQSLPDRLRAMAESFSGFSMSGSSMGAGIREAVVVRGKQAGMIYFQDIGGAWKISAL